MSHFEPYKDLAEKNCRPQDNENWAPLIDDKFIFVGLQESQDMLPGYPVYWRITIYNSEAQGVDKNFKDKESAEETYNTLVAGSIPNRETLVNIWGFEWNH